MVESMKKTYFLHLIFCKTTSPQVDVNIGTRLQSFSRCVQWKDEELVMKSYRERATGRTMKRKTSEYEEEAEIIK